MSTSWRTFGGNNNFEQSNNLNVDNLVTNRLSIRNAYEGILNICGELIVSQNSYFDSDIDIIGNTYCQSNIFIAETLNVELDANISNNVYIRGITNHYNNIYLIGENDSRPETYLVGNRNGVAINKANPESILDIYGSRTESINVFTTQNTNRNILARNNNNHGIVLSTDISASYIDFYHSDKIITNETQRGGAFIYYETNGNLTIDTSNNTNFFSRVGVSNREDKLNSHVNNETFIIYDYSYNNYLPQVYNNIVHSSNTLTLVSNDTCSNTFLNIVNLNNQGWKWGAGTYPNDVSRNMATMGWTNPNTQDYIPTQTIVSGNSLTKNRSTIGINTYSPETEKYIMDINGPVHIHHNEIFSTKIINFEITAISFSPDNNLNGVAVGTSLNLNIPYNYNILYTSDGGQTWNISIINNNENELYQTNVTFNVYYLNTTNIIIGGNARFNYLSKDGGKNWNFFSFSELLFNTKPSIYITSDNHLFLSYPKGTIDSIIYYFDAYNISSNNQSKYIIKHGDINIFCSHGYENIFYAAGTSINTYEITNTSLKLLNQRIENNYNYNAIYTLDGNFTIAVGNNIVSYTNNGGITWIDETWNVVWRDVFILDTSNAIAVGNGGNIIYTIDGANTWKLLKLSDINTMGNANKIINSAYNISSVKVKDINTFVFSVVEQKYENDKTNGITNLYYCFLPDIFNYVNRSAILDISGNMTITGDININDMGKLNTNNETFFLLNKNAHTMYFAGDASNIYIGKSDSNNTTFIRHQLDVSENTYLHKNLIVQGIETIVNPSNSIDLSSGALQIVGGASIQKNVIIGGNSIVYRDISLNGNQNTNGNQTIRNNLTVNNNTILGSNISNNSLTVNGTSFFENDITAKRKLTVYRDVSLNSNVFIGNDTSMNGNLFVKTNSILNNLLVLQDISVNRNLFVSRDISVNRNVFIGNDTSMNGNLFIGKNQSISGNLFIAKTETIGGNLLLLSDFSMNGKQFIKGNQIINGSSYIYNDVSLNGNLTVGNAFSLSNSSLIVNAESIFSKSITVNAQSFFYRELYIEGDISLNGNAVINKNLTVNGNIKLGNSNNTNGRVDINSDTYLNNNKSLYVAKDISNNGFIYNTRGIYTNRIDSLDYINEIPDSRMSIGENTSEINIGVMSNTIIIGRASSTIYLKGTVNISKVEETLNPNIATKSINLNTNSTAKNAYLAGISIQEGGHTPNTRINGLLADEQGRIDAASILTTNDRNSYKFRVPNSSNVVSLNISQWELPNTIDNGILVIKKNTSTTDSDDSDIKYNAVVSAYDISNIVYRDKVNSTSSTQVIPSNIALSGNLSINKNPINSINSALDISGNITHSNGWITQF